jgi:iron complex transport system substrate-binding protein
VAIEAVLAHDPDVILSTDDTTSDPAALWRRWSGLKAVKTGSIYSMSSDTLTRSTPRLAVGAGEVCVALDDARRRLR